MKLSTLASLLPILVLLIRPHVSDGDGLRRAVIINGDGAGEGERQLQSSRDIFSTQESSISNSALSLTKSVTPASPQDGLDISGTYLVEFDDADTDPESHALALSKKFDKHPDYVFESSVKGFVVSMISSAQAEELAIMQGVKSVVPDRVLRLDPFLSKQPSDTAHPIVPVRRELR